MDLAKAKGVIIALLLAFNIFLLYNNLSYFKDRGVQKETIENTMTILKARGITLDCDIPSTAVKTRRLVYGSQGLDKSAIAGSLLGLNDPVPVAGKSFEIGTKKLLFNSETSFTYTDSMPNNKETDINDEAEIGRYTRKYLENAGLIKGKYVIDSAERNGDGSMTVHFIENYSGYLVFDNYCMVTINSKGITRLEYSKLQVLHFSSEKIGNQVSAYQALLANYQKGSGQVITEIDIGYKYPDDQSMEDVETSELLPVWRVKIKGEEEPDYLNPVYTADSEEVKKGTN